MEVRHGHYALMTLATHLAIMKHSGLELKDLVGGLGTQTHCNRIRYNTVLACPPNTGVSYWRKGGSPAGTRRECAAGYNAVALLARSLTRSPSCQE